MSDVGENERRTIEDATCLGCACLCDDIGLVVEGDRIVEARNACPMGRDWFALGREIPEEGPRIDGKPAGWDDAIERSAAILRAAKAPVIWGLSNATIEAQRVAVAIADRVGGIVGISCQDRAALGASQRFGQVGATLGEVKDRADLILYDVNFPFDQFPRLRERYADEASGRFVPQGRAARTIIRLRRQGQPAEPAMFDFEFVVRPESPVDFYASLRAAVIGIALDLDTVERKTGLTAEALVELASRLKQAQYGAFFVANWAGSEIAEEAILTLVRDLNQFTRFVALKPMGAGANRTGAESVLAWQAGAGGHVDFALGWPRHLPQEDAITRIQQGEVDAALLLVGGDSSPTDLQWALRYTEAARRLAQIPRVVVRPANEMGANWTTRGLPHSINALTYEPRVSLPAGRPGIDEGGTVARFDGVMLPLRPPFLGRRPSQAEVLRAILDRLHASKGLPS